MAQIRSSKSNSESQEKGQMMEPFRYAPLDSSKNEIRLIELLPGRLSPGPGCTLSHVSLDARPSYVALSYTWGDPHDTQSINVNDSSVAVTKNLYSALAHLRYEDESRIFWIDALCIDQHNDDEKGWQVQLMRKIYQRAEYVSVWLGPADETSVMDYLHDLGDRGMQCGLDSGPDITRKVKQRWLELAGRHPQRDMPTTIVTVADCGSGKGELRFPLEKLDDLYYSISGYHGMGHIPVPGMEALFTRPWWSRIWVLQEIGLGCKSQLICGKKKISRRRCAAALNAFLVLRWVFSESPETSQTLYSQSIQRTMFEHRPSILLRAPDEIRTRRWSLLALLRLTTTDVDSRFGLGSHSFNATDPRDKIYGLLGLVDRRELDQLGSVPDYNLSCQQLFVNITAALLRQGHICVLSLCQFPKTPTGLPSWMPVWSTPFRVGFQYHENDHMKLLPPYKTSKHLPRRVSITGNTLRIDGFIHDKVFGISTTSWENARGDMCNIEWGQRWLVTIMKLNSIRNTYYKTLTDRVTAAARVATAGLLRKDSRTYIRSTDERFHDALSLLQKPLPNDYFEHVLSKLGLEKMGPYGETNVVEFCAEMRPHALGRTPFVTQMGHLGLGPDSVRARDSIAVFGGGDVPFLVRGREGGTFHLVGEAYVDGIMDGEVVARGQRLKYITLI